ncbi:hypothetical protein Tco_0362405, partial [Tanacetum coccineum]
DENPDDANQDDEDEQTDSDNNGDDFVHPKFSTHDEEDKDEDSFDPLIDEEELNEEAEANELYRDMNVNLEGRDTEMTDVPLPNVLGTQVTEDTHVIITGPVNPEGQQPSSSVLSGF